jgi:cupin superfamily acireductone dioxygenase involved in methionine salvage
MEVEMNNYLDKVVTKVKDSIAHATDSVRKGILTLTGESSVSVNQLAEFIKEHRETKTEYKYLLGNYYYFSHLQENGIHYYLETNGNFILQLDASTKDQVLIAYRSYKDKLSLNSPIKFPKVY